MNGKNTKRNRGIQKISSVALALLAVATVIFLVLFFGRAGAGALTEPSDYGLPLDAENTIDFYFAKENSGVSGTGGSYQIDTAQGLVTIARLSRSTDFAGCTFSIAARGSFELKTTASSVDQFFGIGCEKYPFRGTFHMTSGVTDSTYLNLSGWHTLFNYLSNEAAITSESDSLALCAHSVGQFLLCDTLVITRDGALDISGFRFAATEGNGVTADSTAGFVAGTVVTGGGSAVSVDLTRAFPASAYRLTASAGDAGILFGKIGSGVDIAVTLGDLCATVTAPSGNAGLLVGANSGTLTVKGEAYTFGGSAAAGADDAAGIVGKISVGAALSFEGALTVEANTAFTGGSAGAVAGSMAAGSSLSFGENVTLTAPALSGRLLGGVVGETDGTVEVADGKTCTLTGATLTAAGTSPVLGGAFGRATVAPRGAFTVSSPSLGAAGTMGGFIGSFTANDTAVFNMVSVLAPTFDLSGLSEVDAVGGWFGRIALAASVTLTSNGTPEAALFSNAACGVIGGIAGHVTSSSAEYGLSVNGETLFTVVNRFPNGAAFSGTFGGVVGIANETVYLQISDLSVTNEIGARQDGIADLVGEGRAWAILDISNITYHNNLSSVLISSTAKGTVLRLSGALTDTSGSRTHIVRRQENSLLYADGTTETPFTFSGPSTQVGNAVGNYGQILRNDRVGSIITLSADHRVTISALPSAAISLSSVADAAKLAITLLTEGVFSGIDGINQTNYTNLLSATVTFDADIDLSGTGIEQFTRSDRAPLFLGEIAGNGHTLTLAIGEDLSGTFTGILSPENERRYLGAFSAMSGATVSNLNLAGKIAYASSAGADVRIGALAASATGAITVRDSATSVAITLTSGAFTVSGVNLYAGGFFGQMNNVIATVTGATSSAEIHQSSGYTQGNCFVYLGGFAGAVTATGDMTFTNNIVKAVVRQEPSLSVSFVGGCFARFDANGYYDLNMRGTTAQGAVVSANGIAATDASVSVGGLIGTLLERCRIVLNDSWQGSVTNGATAPIGGLIGKLRGKLTVESGFTLADSSFSSVSSRNKFNGCLVGDGRQAIVTVLCGTDAFAKVTTSNQFFDYLVGQNVASWAASGLSQAGGIVTIETGGATGSLPASDSAWFKLIATHDNWDTRYYFNIAAFESAAYQASVSTTVSSAEDLIYWNAYDYLAAACALSNQNTYDAGYVLSYSYPNAMLNVTSAADNIDMTDYCFYPTTKEGVTFLFGGKTLTFGYTLTTVPPQLYGLHAGIFLDITTSSSNREENRITLGDINFAGRIYADDKNSGALICGTVKGTRDSTKSADALLSVSKVFFYGLRVDSTNDYCPLMINKIDSYVTCEITSVSQYTRGSYHTTDKQTAYTSKAASSLIGQGGITSGGVSSSAVLVKMTDIVFAADSTNAIFTRATLFDSVSYAAGSGSSFTYNFNLDEDWNGNAHICGVTYGNELYTNEEQQKYYDTDVIFVSPVSPSATTAYPFDNYLFYVYVKTDALSVNRKSVDFIDGFGTYRNPYIIRTPAQLLFLSQLVNGQATSPSNGWKINYPANTNSGATITDYTTCYSYIVTGGTLRQGGTADGAELTFENLVSYLRSAYYRIEDDLTMTTAFAGLGVPANPFRGVIVGGGHTVTIPARAGIDNAGFGFINVANGCAVYGITLRYESIALKNSAYSQVTSNPVSTSALTGVVHFGGVIAWVLGGDNRIDNVTVIVDSLTAGHVTSVFGGYIGMVTGGGVIVSGLGAGVSATEIDNTANYFYYNPYVGKILYGYVFSTDRQYDNTEKHISIPFLSGTDWLYNQNCSTTWNSSLATLNLATNRDLLMLGWAMSSGALSYNSDRLGYGKNALSRRGDYSAVGTDFAVSCSSLTSGRYADDISGTGRSLFAAYFGFIPGNYAKTNFDLAMSASLYDMTEFGNAFRGLGNSSSGGACYNVRNVTGAANAGAPGTVIKVNMDVKQYYNGTAQEADSMKNLAFFMERNDSSAVNFQNIIISGKVSLAFYSYGGVEASGRFNFDHFCIAGFVGYAMNANFTNVGIRDLTIHSPEWAGALVASAQYGGGTRVNGCTVEDLHIESRQSAGGLFGYLRVSSGTPVFTNITIKNSEILLKTSKNEDYNSSNNNLNVGGIVGLSLNQSIRITNAVIENTIIGALSSSQNKPEDSKKNLSAGGLIGRSESAVIVENCTVDGCAILAANSPNGAFLTDYESAAAINAPTAVAKAVAALLANRGVDLDGYAGGLIGRASTNLTVTGFTLVSDVASTVILGCRDASGVIGSGNVTGTVSLTNTSVTATNAMLAILGRVSAAGAGTWNNRSGAVYTAENLRICGTTTNRVAILAVGTGNNAGAAGCFGTMTNASITLTGLTLSDCMIAGDAACGVLLTMNDDTSLSLVNAHIADNYIQSDGSASLIVNTAAGAVTVDGTYLGGNTVRRISSTHTNAGVLASTVNGTWNGFFLLMNRNDVAYATAGVPFANFLSGSVALPAGTAYGNAALFVYKNDGTVRLFAVSIEQKENAVMNTRFSQSSAGGASVFFAAYGAPSCYAEAYDTDTPLSCRQAFDAMTASVVTGAGDLTLCGDPVTVTDGDFTPEFLRNTEKLSWWKPTATTSHTAALRTLENLAGITSNAALPVLSISGNVNDAMRAFLALVTGGGYGASATEPFTILSLVATRYDIAADGTLEKKEGEQGSILYASGAFSSATYDILTEEKRSVTIVTITFSADDTHTYSMNIVVYNPQILTVRTYISAIEGEVYKLTSFLPELLQKIDISAGSKFSFYIEYAYDEAVKNITNFNFGKRIYSANGDGTADGTAFAAGSSFILIDLNSISPSGFRYYTYSPGADCIRLDFADFCQANSNAFAPKMLEAIRDLGVDMTGHFAYADGFIPAAVERYLMVCIPAENAATASSHQFNLMAQVTENDRNIVVESEEKITNISVWNEGSGTVTVDGKLDFSHEESGALTATVRTEKIFTEGYYLAMKNRALFGTHVFSVRDTNNASVLLPAGTVITIRDDAGNTLQSIRLSAATASVRYGIADIMGRANAATHTYFETLTVSLDFSAVPTRDFNTAFSGSDIVYYFCDNFYLSGDAEHYANGSGASVRREYHLQRPALVGAAIAPKNRKQLGINLGDPSDETNSGKIDFAVTADFGAVSGLNFTEAKITFSLYQKVYVNGKHTYIAAEDSLAAVTNEDGTPCATTVTITNGKYSGDYRLTVNLPSADTTLASGALTNYRLAVTVTGIIDGSETEYTATDYFVFLICNINDIAN